MRYSDRNYNHLNLKNIAKKNKTNECDRSCLYILLKFDRDKFLVKLRAYSWLIALKI
jgi:hypothetical protein